MNLNGEWNREEFIRREENISHQALETEFAFYLAVKAGNLKVVEDNCNHGEFVKAAHSVSLSRQSIQNLRYHFIITTAMITRFCTETSYAQSIENTEFFKVNGGKESSDFISLHSQKHMYNENLISTAKKTQYGQNVDVGKLCDDTIMYPDEIIYNVDQNMICYKKEYPFNISTTDTPTGSHRVFIPLTTQGTKTIRMSQFPLYGG